MFILTVDSIITVEEYFNTGLSYLDVFLLILEVILRERVLEEDFWEFFVLCFRFVFSSKNNQII